MVCHTEKGKFTSVQLMSVSALTYVLFNVQRKWIYLTPAEFHFHILPTWTVECCYCAMGSCSRFDHVGGSLCLCA